MGVLRELEHGPLSFLNKAVLKRTAKEFMDQVVAYNYMNFYPKGGKNRPFGSGAYANEGYYDGVSLDGRNVSAMPVKGVRAFHAMDPKYRLKDLGGSHKVANDNLRDVLAGGHGGLGYGDYQRLLRVLVFKVMNRADERRSPYGRDQVIKEEIRARCKEARKDKKAGKGDGMISMGDIDLGDKEMNRSRRLLVKAAGYGVLPEEKEFFSCFDTLFMDFVNDCSWNEYEIYYISGFRTSKTSFIPGVDRDLVKAEDPKTIKANRENYIKRVSGDRFSMAVARGDKRAMAAAFILGEDPKGRSSLERARLWFGRDGRSGLEEGKLWSGGSKDMFKGMGMNNGDRNWGVESPVIEAAKHGRSDLAKFLCEGGLDSCVKSKGKDGVPGGLSPLSVAAYYNQVDFFRAFDGDLEALFTERVGDKTIYEDLRDRAGRGRKTGGSKQSSAKAILRNLAIRTETVGDVKRATRLVLAVGKGDIGEMTGYSSSTPVNGEPLVRAFDRPLFEAAKHGQVEAAKALLGFGANEDLTSYKVPGLSLISQAALHGQPEFFDFMLTRGADPKVLMDQDVKGISVYAHVAREAADSPDGSSAKILRALQGLKNKAKARKIQDKGIDTGIESREVA